MPSRAFYDAVADALTSFLPPSLRDFDWYRTAHNIKVWFGTDRKEHYEVQHLRKGKQVLMEIGFHSEHADAEANEQAVAKLMAQERSWRKALGKDPEAGPFIGFRSNSWRRISELWDQATEPDAAIEAAERLAAYIQEFEKVRSG